MYYYPYSAPVYYPYYADPPCQSAVSYVRVLHASPDAPAVDVYANGTLIAQNLSYRGFTEYQTVPPGSYRFQVFPAGQTTRAVIDTQTAIPPCSIYTIAAIGKLTDIRLLPIPDTPMPPVPGKALIRFAHLSPNAPNVDIVLPDGTPLFKNVSYTQVTNYLPVDPGTYTVEARPAGTNTTVLYVPNISLSGDRFYTIYAVGLVNASPPLQVLIPLDGNSYIRF